LQVRAEDRVCGRGRNVNAAMKSQAVESGNRAAGYAMLHSSASHSFHFCLSEAVRNCGGILLHERWVEIH